VQSGPTHEFHVTAVQIEISCQHGLDVSLVRITVHRLTQFYDTTEFITAAIRRVGQDELCVVLCGHVLTLRERPRNGCELGHKFLDSGVRTLKR